MCTRSAFTDARRHSRYALQPFDYVIMGKTCWSRSRADQVVTGLMDKEIQAVMNDFAVPGSNSAGADFKKALLCLYGMTAPPSC